MERATVMKTYRGNLTPKSPTPKDRDASFSSYLQPHHHHTIGSDRCRGLDDSTSELSIFDAHKYFNDVTNNDNNIQKVTTTSISSSSSNSRVSPLVNNTNNMDMEGIIPERGEIITETTRYSSASSSVDGYNSNMRNYRTRSFHAAATPTASSEASWNSQAGLLSHPQGAIPVSMMRNPSKPTDLNKKLRASLSKPIWFLRKKCPCSGKKSVEVKEKKTQMPPPSPQRQDHEIIAAPKKPETLENIIPTTPNNWVVATTKSQSFHSHRVVTSSVRDGFTFPVLNQHSLPSISSSTTINNNKLHVPNGVVVSEKEDPARDSLEVFQPPSNNDTMELATVSPKSRINVMIDEDARSDASSDLFEIESFSTTTAATQPTCPPVIYRRRDSIDEASSNNGFFFCRRNMDERSTKTTECYEPSEASIEWSVTTAAAEDESGGGAVQGNGEKWKKKGSSSSSLISCRSEKAVSVGPQPVRAVEGHRGATCSSKHVMNVSSSIRVGVSSVTKPPLPNSHVTPCLSLAFAT